jgi:hypothetical protein
VPFNAPIFYLLCTVFLFLPRYQLFINNGFIKP